MRRYSREDAVQRGISRLGEDEYNAVFNNCERFVDWRINGAPISRQVEGRLIGGMETVISSYIANVILPSNASNFLRANTSVGFKLVSIFSRDVPVFKVLGTAMLAAKLSRDLIVGVGDAIDKARRETLRLTRLFPIFPPTSPARFNIFVASDV